MKKDKVSLRKETPEVVSIVALGSSKTAFFVEALTTGNRRGVADEVWVINKLGCLVKHDVLWRMDDLTNVYACNDKNYSGGGIKEPTRIHDTFTDFLKNTDKPIITSTAYPDEFPMSYEYPLEDVINTIGYSYFRTTPAYAAAFAIHIGVKQLRIYGCDYTYPDSKYKAEAGRANMEFILGIGMTMGMEVYVPPTTSLLDSCMPTVEKMYGYKYPIEVKPDPDDNSRWKTFPRPDIFKQEAEKKQLAEEQQLQELLNKYNNIVKEDMISGGWITKADIDEYNKKQKEYEKKQKELEKECSKNAIEYSKNALKASSKKKTTSKGREKELKNGKSKKIHKRNNKRSK